MTFKVKGNRGRDKQGRIPKRLTNPKSVKIIRCKYCREPITFSYNSIGRDGLPFATNVDGTKHVDGLKGGPRK